LHGILVVDESGAPLFVNQTVARMFGYATVDEVMAIARLELLAVPECRERVRAFRQELIRDRRELATIEWIGQRKDGTEIWLESQARPITWGGRRAAQAAITDITARKVAERELASRHAFDRVLSDLSAKFLKMTPEEVMLGIARGLQQVCHSLDIDRCSFYECAEDGKSLLLVHSYAVNGNVAAVPKNLTEALPWFANRLLQGQTMVTAGPIDLPPAAVAEREYSQRERIRSSVSIPISLGGSRFCALAATALQAPREWPQETIEQLRLLGEIFTSALARRRDDQSIRQREDRFRDLAEVSVDWVWEADQNMRITYVSDRFLELLGVGAEQVLGKTGMEVVGADPKDPEWRRRIAQMKARQQFRDFRVRWTAAHGSEHYLSISGRPVFDETGAFRGYRGVGRDVTRSALNEAVLRESADRVRDFAEATSDWFWETDSEHRITYVSGAAAGWDDVGIESLIGQSLFVDEGADDDAEKWQRHREDLAHGRAFRNFRYKRPRRDGGTQHISASGRPYFALDGSFLGYRGTGLDITAEVEARTQLNDAIESMSDAVVIFDKEERIVFYNRAFLELNSRFAGKIRPGVAFRDLLELVTASGQAADAVGREQQWIEERLDFFRRGKGLLELRLDDGRWLQVADRRTESGYTIGLRTDITASKQREVQLRQAQKMEAIGQLTGGVAHDFNNLLAIIQGNITLLEKQLDENDPRRNLTAPVLRATKRGASLTHRLLAFSRRQPLEHKVVDAGELVDGMQELLHRSLGESIAFEILPDEDHWTCVVDPGQLEQAILNLAINARDAMPGGGRLLIEVANAELNDAYAAAQAEVRPGEYVMIAVSDTGCGMSPEIASHIFEPFFTTKDVGKGTGLGLSMVFGFAKQSNGHITAYSEPGHGSTFKLYLPRSHEAVESVVADPAPGSAEPTGAGQLVLLVEDDLEVRQMGALLLRGLGYRVLEAERADDALRHLGTERIELLLTDVMLPGGVDGRQLAMIARDRCPGLKVLYMSGHIFDSAARNSRLELDGKLLRKPFEAHELARMVASTLAASEA